MDVLVVRCNSEGERLLLNALLKIVKGRSFSIILDREFFKFIDFDFVLRRLGLLVKAVG